MDPEALPIDRLCNLVYYWLVRSADERRRAEIDSYLNRPPPGQTVDEGVWSSDAEMAAFSKAAAAAGRVAS